MGWSTTNVSGFITNVTQSSDAVEGSSSARGEIIVGLDGTSPYPPVLSAGLTSQAPVTQAYTGITGHYKLQTSHNDMMLVTSQLFDASMTLVANAEAQFPGAAGWTLFEIPYDYGQGTSTDPPAFVQLLITIEPGSSPAQIGAVLHVDALELTGGVQGVDDLRGPWMDMELFPNPITDQASFNFDLPAARTVILEVFDMQGRPVQREHLGTLPTGEHRMLWTPSQELANGPYLLVLHADEPIARRTAILHR